MIARTRDHEIVMDVRKERGGDDAGATPPEFMAMALGGCILNVCRILAMQKGIVLEDLRVSVSGDIDPSRAFGISEDQRAGYLRLSARVETGSTLSEAAREEFSGSFATGPSLRYCREPDTPGGHFSEMIFSPLR